MDGLLYRSEGKVEMGFIKGGVKPTILQQPAENDLLDDMTVAHYT